MRNPEGVTCDATCAEVGGEQLRAKNRVNIWLTFVDAKQRL